MSCEKQMKSLINEYKRILKRHLPRNQSNDRINTLDIKRKHLRHASHSELYEKSLNVLNDIDRFITSRSNNPSNFCGLRSFADHLQSVIQNHVLNEHHTIVNAPQKASKAVVNTIQLMNKNPIEEQLQAIQDNIHVAIKYGSRDQKRLLIKALNQKCERISILQPLVELLAG